MPGTDSVVLTSVTERPEEADGAFAVVRIDVGGDPGEAATIRRVIDDYASVTGRAAPDAAAMCALADRQVSVLMHGANMLGAPLVTAECGRVFVTRAGHPALLPKGSRKNGIRLSEDKVLDIEDGYGSIAPLRERVRAVRGHYPSGFEPLTEERLRSLPRERSGTVGLVLFGTLPGFGVAGAIWLLTDYEPDDDIANGVLVVPPGAATSEHGSVWGRDLFGRYSVVPSFRACTFGDAVGWCGIEHEGWDGYRRVLRELFGT